MVDFFNYFYVLSVTVSAEAYNPETDDEGGETKVSIYNKYV